MYLESAKSELCSKKSNLAVLESEGHCTPSLNSVTLISHDTWDVSSVLTDNLEKPTHPQPILDVPIRLHGETFYALVDSGALDSFISQKVVRAAKLPLKNPFRVNLANEEEFRVTHYTRITLYSGAYKALGFH